MKGSRLNLFHVLFFAFAVIVPISMADDATAHNSTRRELGRKYKGPCVAYNSIDKCWRCDPNWANNRKRLADCAQGFGHNTHGGKDGEFYVVTDPSDNDLVNPKPGTLRHAVTQKEPLWIIFDRNMNIRLSQELIMESDKTIDARGFNIHIMGGAGITIQFVHNIIIHNLHMHDIHTGNGGMIRSSVDHVGIRGQSDGDAINVFGSRDIWIDHISLSRSDDGLIDVVKKSTDVTISNCHFVKHDKALLFGASDIDPEDKEMRVTVAFNHFGKGLTQRLPAVRWGFVHVVNNDYTHWQSYAIGGADGATVISQGNRYIAQDGYAKKVTFRKNVPESIYRSWTWRSEGDLLLNGAIFEESGDPNWAVKYKGYKLIKPARANRVNALTRFSGSLPCKVGLPC